MSLEFLKEIEQKKKPKITNIELSIREQIETFYLVMKELLKEMEEMRKKGKDISNMEESLKKLEETFEQISSSVTDFEIGKN